MPHAAYPTADEIGAYLRALGILSAADLTALLADIDLDGIAGAAQAAWEADTGWKPFLWDGTTSARRFDPPGPNNRGFSRGGIQRLHLDAGLLQVTGIVSGYSMTDAGDAVTVEDDYYLYPSNANGEGRPWTAVDFLTYQWGLPQSIQITGYWGYAANLPDDAWEAILRYAAGLIFAELTLQVSGGMERWTEADVTEVYDLKGWDAHADRWERAWKRAVTRYRRPYL